MGVDVAVVAVVPATAADEVVVAAPLPEPDQVRLGDLPVERFNQVVTPAGSPTSHHQEGPLAVVKFGIETRQSFIFYFNFYDLISLSGEVTKGW